MTHAESAPSSIEPPQRFQDLVAALIDAVLTSPGHLPPAERRAAFAGEQMEGPLGAFAEKVRRRAYTVTDDDIEALRRHGLDEDAIFELTIACALGEAHAQLRTGLAALGYDT
jgi:alkylhydroperoxidase family enzyme